MKRVLLALIPVALMASASLALPGLTPEPMKIFSTASQPLAQTPAAPPSSTAPVVAQSAPAQSATQGEELAQSTDESQNTELAQAQPLPQLVVDKTQLVEAMSVLVRATEQAKLSVTAVDAEAQRIYIQETINLLAGSDDAHFRQLTQATGAYTGAISLLDQALLAREGAEATWLAEIEKLSGEVAGSGSPATSPNVIKMLGTRGLRPEEQASQLLERALTHAVQALAVASAKPEAAIQREDVPVKFASDEATAIMEGVVKVLESALKIVQIAVDR